MSQFIGGRIVPIHGGVWDKTKTYEVLTIVLYKPDGDSYISRKAVPAGTAITDTSYWMLYSLYSQQIADAVKEMEQTESDLKSYVDKKASAMETRVKEAETLTNDNKDTLNTRMDGIDKRLDANVTASTDSNSDYAAEVVDARVDTEGTTYGSLGAHLRAVGDGSGILRSAINGSRLSFMDITPELTWTEDQYIRRADGNVYSFEPTANAETYFCTVDYVTFPYAGAYIQLLCAMSTADADKSGIAFYDADKTFISGSEYDRTTDKLSLKRIFVPEGTAYMRLTCYKKAQVDGVKVWLDDCMVPTGAIAEGAVTPQKTSWKEILLTYELTADQYVTRYTGEVKSFEQEENLYFCTLDFIPFPYAGSLCLIRASMSTADTDQCGICFYDGDENFISAVKYDQKVSGELSDTEFICPEGTQYIRFDMYKEELKDKAKFWFLDDAVSEGKIIDGAVTPQKASWMEIPLNYELTADKYVTRFTGELIDFTDPTDLYFCTVDFIPFPYAGSRCVIRASMSTASNDRCGICFYDADQNFISGVKYDQKVDGELSDTEFTCPAGTQYIRFDMYKEELKDSAKLWFLDGTASEGRIADGAVTTSKLADGAVTIEKLSEDIVARLDSTYSEPLATNLPENPLDHIREVPGYLSVFLHVGCIGDSLASGEAYYKNTSGSGGRDMFIYSWGQFLARMTGNTYYNWSKGGLRCDTFLSSSMATECYDGEHLCEAYIIGLGQNENNKKYTIGTSADIDADDYSQNADSYYGNYGKIIQKIKEVQPKAKIFVLTDPLAAVENGGYNDAVREIATLFDNVYLVDLFKYGTDLYSSGFLATQKRSGHYNAVGYYLCALIIATYIDWIIKKYPEEFREVEFIGTTDSYY